MIMNESVDENEFIKVIDALAKYWSLITVGILFLAIIIVLLFVLQNRRYVRTSISRMNTNINTKKYIRSIYVEIGDTNERLRYFSCRKMRRKLKNRFAFLFRDNLGKVLKKRINILSVLGRPVFLKRAIAKALLIFHKDKNKTNIESYAKTFGQYHIEDLLKRFSYYNQLYDKNAILIKGNAGSGKTNLICNYVDYLNKRKAHFIYVNAKDVNGSLEEYFCNSFFNKNFPNKIKTVSLYLHWLILRLFRKKIFIIIEAINEKDDYYFENEVINFVKKYNHNPFKIVISTREEHFNKSFESSLVRELGEEYEKIVSTITIASPREEDYEFDFVYSKYCDAFNFKGTISSQTRNIISKSFFVLRLFFESYKDKSIHVGINGPEDIFNAYIKSLDDDNHTSSIILEKMCKIMRKNKNYEYVYYKDLFDKNITHDSIDKLINESALVYKYISSQKNKMLEESEALFIVYDEFRDFLLARLILNHSKSIIKDLSTIIKSKSTVSEGVTKYIYNYYRSRSNFKWCRDIVSISGFESLMVNSGGRAYNRITLIANYFVDNVDIPTDRELLFFDSSYHYDADALWETVLHNLPNRLEMLRKMVDYSMTNIGGMIDCAIRNKGQKSYYQWILDECKGANINDRAIIDYFSDLYDNADEDYNSGYDSYSSPLINRVSFDYIVFDNNKKLSVNVLLKRLSISKHSYYGDKIKAIVLYLYSPSWSLHKEYTCFYKHEFTNYQNYLAQVMKVYLDYDLIGTTNLYCKYIFSYNNGAVSAFLSNKEIAKVLVGVKESL